ncbi:MAG: cobinamide kinase [Ruminococcaceae bacterium]|nr:cobinamide kinase [Oscillospiraceae bacterium]
MIFITGPMFSGKRAAAKKLLGCDDAELETRCACDVQELVHQREDIEALADELAKYDAVTAAEIGGGVVPLDPGERAARERAGRLACLLAERAETVVRVFCGIPKTIKGEKKK